MADITWQDPPTSGRGGKWRAIAAQLRENPGKWALVHTGSPGVASTIKSGGYSAMPRGAFEAVTRKRSDGEFDIYARFVGSAAS